jgi:hypothetical protein
MRNEKFNVNLEVTNLGSVFYLKVTGAETDVRAYAKHRIDNDFSMGLNIYSEKSGVPFELTLQGWN